MMPSDFQTKGEGRTKTGFFSIDSDKLHKLTNVRIVLANKLHLPTELHSKHLP
jgi:hypothetical protein